MREVVRLRSLKGGAILKKLVSVLIACVLVFSMSMPVYADGGYIVRTTVETVETTNGVVTNYSKQVYDSPVQYGPLPAPAAAPATATKPAATTCTTNGGWTPNWGANYAADQARYMNSAQKVYNNGCWQPCNGQPTYGYAYSYTTLGDEARARAADVKSYAESHGWSVSVSGDWGDCNYRNIEITISNKNHSRTWLQKTVVVNGGYQTHYERDGHSEWLDDVKFYIKDRKV